MRRAIQNLTGQIMGVMGLVVISGAGSALWCVPIGGAAAIAGLAMIWEAEL